MTKAALLITAYNPGMDLARFAGELALAGIRPVVVADGGNEPAAPAVADALRAVDGCHVLRTGTHAGRGAALKEGFAYLREHYPDTAGVVVTEYGRGFSAGDVLILARALESGTGGILLGCPARNIKWKETAAGRIVRISFALLAGIKLYDPFISLRGFSAAALSWLHDTRREQEACEPAVLLAASREGLPVSETALDSAAGAAPSRVSFAAFLRVYLLLILFASSSLLSYLVDIGLYALLIGTVFTHVSDPILYSTVAARICSSLLNFAINKRVVFRDMRSDYGVLARYVILTVLRMFASYAGVFALTAALSVDSRIVKVFVDLILFFVGFRVQQSWVFAQQKK